MGENVCASCHGSGTQWSGVEYMGQHEIVGCDECWGTGFDDVLAGVDDLRALLAQRDGELEALRGKVGRVQNEAQRIYDMGVVSVYESAQEIGEIFLAALSDNPESPELPEDSTCKLPHGYLDPRLGRCPNCNRPINDVPDRPDNPESPALTDKEDKNV